MNKPPQVRIFVALLGEDVEVWRPVDAVPLGSSKYKIVSHNPDFEDEHWEFEEDDIVHCEPRIFFGGEQGLVAIEKCDSTI